MSHTNSNTNSNTNTNSNSNSNTNSNTTYECVGGAYVTCWSGQLTHAGDWL